MSAIAIMMSLPSKLRPSKNGSYCNLTRIASSGRKIKLIREFRFSQIQYAKECGGFYFSTSLINFYLWFPCSADTETIDHPVHIGVVCACKLPFPFSTLALYLSIAPTASTKTATKRKLKLSALHKQRY